MRKKLLINCCLFILGLSACEQPPEVDTGLPPLFTVKGGLYILNEGNFQSGNASIDYIDFESQQFSENAYEKVNNTKLGDVVQSMCVQGSVGYLVVNNSQKIEVINLNNLNNLNTITGFVSPRYMVVNNAQQAYVTEFYNGGVKMLNLNTNQIEKTIDLKGNLNELLIQGNELFVTNSNGNYLYVINTDVAQVTDSIYVAFGANSLVKDANGNVWVLCSGKKVANVDESGALYCINPSNKKVIKQFTLGRQSDHGPIKLRINRTKDKLYWLNKHVYEHHINSIQISVNAFVYAHKKNYWGLRVDTLYDEVYVADAIDYVQKSNVERYDANGTMKGIFKAGIITTDFYFYYK